MKHIKYLSPFLTIISAFALLILAIMDTDFFFYHFWSLMFYADTVFLFAFAMAAIAFLVSLISVVVFAIKRKEN